MTDFVFVLTIIGLFGACALVLRAVSGRMSR